MKNIFYKLIFSAIVLGLIGCSDKSANDTENKPNLTDVISQKSAEVVKNEVVQISLPIADKAMPTESYVEYNSGNQLMFSYLALVSMPIDYKQIAKHYSVDYARESDEFKKNDLLTALKPKIDSEVAKANSQRYIKILNNNYQLKKYDFEIKGFSLDGSIGESNSYRYYGDNSEYKLGYTNGEAFRHLKVSVEDDARKIETMRSNYEQMNITIYCFIKDTDPSTKTVKAEIIKVVLRDKEGNVLASQ